MLLKKNVIQLKLSIVTNFQKKHVLMWKKKNANQNYKWNVKMFPNKFVKLFQEIFVRM